MFTLTTLYFSGFEVMTILKKKIYILLFEFRTNSKFDVVKFSFSIVALVVFVNAVIVLLLMQLLVLVLLFLSC